MNENFTTKQKNIFKIDKVNNLQDFLVCLVDGNKLTHLSEVCNE